MRILFVTPWFPTPSAPVAGVFVQRDALLIGEKHDVEILHLVDPSLISTDDEDAGPEFPLPVHRLPMSRSRPGDLLKAWRKIRELSRNFDVVHTHAFQALLPFAGHRLGRAWVHSEHWSGVGDPGSLTGRGRLVFRLAARLLRRPDVVTAVSTHLSDQVRRHRSGPVTIVPSVVADIRPAASHRDSETLRLVAVGNLVEGKDPQLAIDTVFELRNRGVRTALDWVGDGPLRSQLEKRIVDDDGIRLHGVLDARGVSTTLAGADMFLLPTRGETLCLSAIEAISHGRPVVMGARGGQRDYVTEDNGRLVEERTPSAYADAVEDVRKNLDRLTPEKVAATIRDRFSAGRVLQGYEQAYEQALSMHPEVKR